MCNQLLLCYKQYVHSMYKYQADTYTRSCANIGVLDISSVSACIIYIDSPIFAQFVIIILRIARPES
jgi:hypothetical protein